MLSALSLLLQAPQALAAEAAAMPRFDGVVYIQWGVDLTEGSDLSNAVDVSRAYFGARQEIGDHLAARVLIDAGRGPDAGKQWVYVKNAFVEWKDPAPGVKLQAGMIGTPYVGFVEKFWGHRYAAKAFADEFKLLSSADFGVGATGTHADGLLDWHAVAINGEGYGSPEVDATKTIQARVSVDPLAKGGKMNLVLTGFGSYGTAAPDTDPATAGKQVGDANLQYAGAVGLRMTHLVVWGEYDGRQIGATAAAGWSATVMPRMPKVGALYLRYDRFDPDVDGLDDGTDRLIVGVSHDFFKKVSLALQFERVVPEATPAEPSHGLFAKAQAGF